MTKFEALFGIKNTDIKANCILLPIITKDILSGFNIKNIPRGKLYGAANMDNCTLIHTGIGPAFTGDAVLYLKDTPCKNVILFGSCGLVNEKSDMSIGSLVSPSVCYSQGSFTDMLLKAEKKQRAFYPDKKLFENFFNFNETAGLKKAACSTIASLKLEEDMVDFFIENRIDVVDMECSAFFSSADFSSLKATALFYISDVIKKAPFYQDLNQPLRKNISISINNASRQLCKFIKMKLSV